LEQVTSKGNAWKRGKHFAEIKATVSYVKAMARLVRGIKDLVRCMQ